MADTKQKLGIELSLTLDSKFGDLVKQIENAFSKVDLKGFEAKVAGVEGKVSKLAEEIAKVTKGSSEKIQLDLDTSRLNKKISDATGVIEQYKNVVVDANGKVVSSLKEAERVQAEINKAYAQRASQNSTSDKVARQIEATYRKEEMLQGKKLNMLATLQQKEEAISASKENRDARELQSTLRKIDQENAAFDRQQQQTLRALSRYKDQQEKEYNKLFSYENVGNNFMAGLSKQGLKIFNGDIIPKTYITDIDKAREAATKYTATLERMSEAEKRAAMKSGSEFMTAIGKQGFKIFNGDLVPKSYITDINAATDAAYKMKAALEANSFKLGGNSSTTWARDIATQSKQAEAYLRSLGKQGFEYVNGEIIKTNRETKNFLTTLTGMAGLEMKFYGIRSVLFGITGQFRNAISSIIDYKQTVTEIGAITTATDDEMKQYEKTISQLARSSKYAATEIASAMKVVAQSGIQRNELIPVTRASELLAAATGGSPEAAANVVTTTMNVWQVAADKAIGLTNTMATAMKNSKLNVNDLAESFNYVASSAHAANMSVDETLSTIAAMRNKGVVASTVGTGLRQFLKVLEAPTPKVLAMFHELELGARDVDPKLRALGDILNDISERGIKKYGSEMALSTKLSEAFEMRTGNAAKVIISSGDAIKSLTLAMKNSEAGFLALERSLEGPRVKLNKIQHEFMLFVQLLGDDVIKAITGGTDGLLNFTKGLQDTEVRMNVLGVAVGGLALIITTSITAIGASIQKLYLSNPWLLALTVAFTAYSAVVLATAGNLKYVNKEQEEFFKRSKEEADLNQRQTNELNKFIGTLTTVNGHKQTLNELTVEQKKHLDALKPSMKGMLDNLSTEKSLAEQLIGVMEQLAVARGKNLLSQAKQYNTLKDSVQYKRNEAETLEENAGNKHNPAVGVLVKAAELDALKKPASDPWKRSGSYMARYGVDKPSDVSGFIASVDVTAWSLLRARDLKDQAAAQDADLAKYEVMVGDLPKGKNGHVNMALAEASVNSINEADNKKKRADAGQYKGSDKFGRETAGAEAAHESNAIKANHLRVAALHNEIEELKIQLSDTTTTPEAIATVKDKMAKKYKAIYDLELLIAKEEDAKANLSTKGGSPEDIALIKNAATDSAKAKYDKAIAELNKLEKETGEKQHHLMLAAEQGKTKDQETIGKSQLPALEKVMKDHNRDIIDRKKAYNDALAIEYKVLDNEFDRQLLHAEGEFAHLPEDKKKEYLEQKKRDLEEIRKREKEAAKAKYDSAFNMKMNPMTEEKMSQMTLANLQAAVKLRKDQAVSAEEVHALDVESMHFQQEHLNKLLMIWGMVEKGTEHYDEAQQKIAAVRIELNALNAEIAKQKDMSFANNFLDGWNKASIAIGTVKDLYSKVGGQAYSGVVDSIDKSVSMMMGDYDKAAVEKTKSSIREITLQLADYQDKVSQIKSKGSMISEADKNNMQTYKVKVAELNLKLKEQHDILNDQTNAWKSLKTGISNVLKDIAAEIRRFMINKAVVGFMNMLINLVPSGMGSTSISSSAVPSSGVGSATPGGELFSNTGGLITSSGVYYYADGGQVPLNMGTPGKDSVRAWLTPGEIVISEPAVRKYGAKTFLDYNAQRFAAGGIVAGGAKASSSSSAEGQPFTLNIINVADPSSIPTTTGTDIINTVSFSLTKKDVLYKQIKGILQGK